MENVYKCGPRPLPAGTDAFEVACLIWSPRRQPRSSTVELGGLFVNRWVVTPPPQEVSTHGTCREQRAGRAS